MLQRAALEGGAERVGWKIGFNVPAVQEKLGIAESVVGHLTTATMLSDDAVFTPRDAGDLRAELEVAVQVGADGSITGYAPAVELVDLAGMSADVEAMVAGNIFHRAFAIGALTDEPPGEGVATLAVGGEVHDAVNSVPDFEATLDLVRRRLEAAGEELREGDLVITGALVVAQVSPGQRIEADVPGLGAVSVSVT